MSDAISKGKPSGRGTAVLAAAAAVLMAGAFAAPAWSQDAKTDAGKADAPKADAAKTDGKAAGAAGKDGAAKTDGKAAAGPSLPPWNKICFKVPTPKRDAEGKEVKDADGKPVREEKQACTTFYESFHPANGAPLVYFAVEEGEGIDKKVLTVRVPEGLALPAGLAVAVFSKEQSDKLLAAGKEGKTLSVEELGLKPLKLDYIACLRAMCDSVLEAPADFIEQMKAGEGVMIRAKDLQNKVVDFPVTLANFGKALTGTATDAQEYFKFRKDKLAEMAQKRKELAERLEKQKAELAKDEPKPKTPEKAPEKAPEKK